MPTGTRIVLSALVLLSVLPGGAAFTSAAAAPDPVALSRADSLYTAQAWAAAAEAYGELAGEATDGRFWYRYGSSLHQLGRLDDAIKAYEKADSIAPNPFVGYNMACALASRGRTAEALTWLEKAAAAGFNQLAMMESDPELAPLRADPRYVAVRTVIDRSIHPCAHDPQYRQLDFLIGDWNVTGPGGRPAGRSHVELILSDCVIFENWTDFGGSSGKSFNIIDPATRAWRQTWVSDRGNLHEYTGAFEDGAMRYRRETKDSAGAVTLHRMTFFPLGPDLVRQLGESSTDKGATWAVTFDLHYHRDKSATTPAGATGG
jgi:hypothetical protein